MQCRSINGALGKRTEGWSGPGGPRTGVRKMFLRTRHNGEVHHLPKSIPQCLTRVGRDSYITQIEQSDSHPAEARKDLTTLGEPQDNDCLH